MGGAGSLQGELPGYLSVLVATAHEEVYRGEARMLKAPGTEGEFSVLPGHAPLLTCLKPGVLRIECPPGIDCDFGRCDEVLIHGGYIEVQPCQVTVLADAVERAADIDMEKTEKAIESARRILRGDDAEKISLARAELELDLARMRIIRNLTKQPPGISN